MTTIPTVLGQTSVPFTAANELLVQKYSVPGGTLYVSALKSSTSVGASVSLAQSFVPSASGGLTRYLRLTDAKSDAGVPLAATAGSGVVGISRTAGTSLQLVGEATSASAKTDKALFEFDLPDSYVPGANIPVDVNCLATGGTITAASTTMTVAAYTEVNGVETPLTVSGAQEIPSTAADLIFTVTGTGLQPGSHVLLELTMLVTTSAGAGMGTINSVSYQA